jgi:hypothetical protein
VNLSKSIVLVASLGCIAALGWLIYGAHPRTLGMSTPEAWSALERYVPQDLAFGTAWAAVSLSVGIVCALLLDTPLVARCAAHSSAWRTATAAFFAVGFAASTSLIPFVVLDFSLEHLADERSRDGVALLFGAPALGVLLISLSLILRAIDFVRGKRRSAQ